MYKANICITLRPSILDPQGKAVSHALETLGYDTIDRVRMGKYVELWIDEATEEAAERAARAACEKLLEMVPDFGEMAWSYLSVWHFEEGIEARTIEGLRKAGLEIPARPA